MYYENGNRKSVGNYINNKSEGKEYNFYEDATPKSELEFFSQPEKNLSFTYKVNNYWSKDRTQMVLDGNGNYEINDEDSFEKGVIKNGLRQGEWQGREKVLKIDFTEFYHKGELIRGKSIDENKKEIDYKQLNENPVPTKGINHFYTYMSSRLRVPQEAMLKRISGKIYITFYVEKEGFINDARVVKALGYGLDEEALRTLYSYGSWIPGKKRGVLSRFYFSIPLTVVVPD
jgi:TonB family protein